MTYKKLTTPDFNTELDTSLKKLSVFPRTISLTRIWHTLSMTIGWFAITSNWSILPQKISTIYTILRKNIELGSECKMADNPFFPRDNFRPIIRLWILQIDFYLTSGSPHYKYYYKMSKMAAKLRQGSWNLLAEIGARMILFAIFM